MATRTDPYLNNRFRVEIDGIALSGFAEVALPEVHADVTEYRDGNDPFARKLPGAIHVGNLLLRNGVTKSRELFDWWKETAAGVAHRRTVVVILQDEAGQDVKRWVITHAWPMRYTVEPLVALDGDVTLIETLECATEGFEVVA
jgi:phage tail-like protein